MGYSQHNPRSSHAFKDESDHKSEVSLAHGQLVVLSSLTDSIMHLLEDFQHQLRVAMQPYANESLDGVTSNMDQALQTVELLFNVLLFDTQLPETVKVHISRMQTLYVKIAASDSAFYHQEDHPARCLLSYLVNEAKSVDYDAEVECKIIHTVEQILANYDADNAIFEKLIVDFQKKKNRNPQLDQSRQAQANLGKDIDALVKACINTTIQSGSSQHLTQEVQSFVRGPWQAYLFWIALNDGIQSPLWETAKSDLAKIISTMDVSVEWLAGQRVLTINKLKVSVNHALAVLKLGEEEQKKWHEILDKEWQVSSDELTETVIPITPQPVTELDKVVLEQESNEDDTLAVEEEMAKEDEIHCPKNFPEQDSTSVEEIEMDPPTTPFGKI